MLNTYEVCPKITPNVSHIPEGGDYEALNF